MRDDLYALLTDRAIAGNSARLRDIVEFRGMLEPEIAAQAAARRDEKDLKRIQAILLAQERNIQDGKDDPDEDMHFHQALARASKNEVLREVSALLYDILRESRVPPLQTRERKTASLAAHKAVFAALERGDQDGCRQAMREHLRDVAALVLGE